MRVLAILTTVRDIHCLVAHFLLRHLQLALFLLEPSLKQQRFVKFAIPINSHRSQCCHKLAVISVCITVLHWIKPDLC